MEAIAAIAVDRCVHVGPGPAQVRCCRPSGTVWMMHDLAIAGTCADHSADSRLISTFERLGATRVARDPVQPTAAEVDAMLTLAYEQEKPGLLRWLRSRLRSDAEAEDCCQEAFARLLVEMRAGRVPDSPAAWLHRVASNLLISGARHATVVARHPVRPDPGEGRDPVAIAVVARERFAEVDRALAARPAGERALLLLAAGGATTERIASELRISPAAARTRLHRARRQLERATSG